MGHLLIKAGAVSAILWVLGMGARMGFQMWTEHGGGSDDVARFSLAHHITSEQAWVAAFVLMALTEVVTRVATIYVRSRTAARARLYHGGGAHRVRLRPRGLTVDYGHAVPATANAPRPFLLSDPRRQWAANIAIMAAGILTIRPMGFSGRGLAVLVLFVISCAGLLIRTLPPARLPKGVTVLWLTLAIVAAAGLIGVSRSGTSYLFAFFVAGHIGYRLETRAALVLATLCGLLCGAVLYFRLGPGYHELPWILGLATGTPVLMRHRQPQPAARRRGRDLRGRIRRAGRPRRGPGRGADRTRQDRPGRARRPGALPRGDQHAAGAGRRAARHR